MPRKIVNKAGSHSTASDSDAIGRGSRPRSRAWRNRFRRHFRKVQQTPASAQRDLRLGVGGVSAFFKDPFDFAAYSAEEVADVFALCFDLRSALELAEFIQNNNHGN